MQSGTELAPVRRWERWQQPPATTMPREPYSPQEAAAAADAIWAAIGVMLAGEVAGESPQLQSHAHFTQEPQADAETAATAASLG